VAVLALTSLASPSTAQTPTPFALKNVIAPTDTISDSLTVYVSTSGTPLPAAELTTQSNWHVAIVDYAASRPIAIDRADWDPATKVISLLFRRDSIKAVDLRSVGWQVAFTGSQLLAASADAPSKGRFKPAKGKDDAALYLLSSFLAGRSTKPSYVIDAKADYKDELGTSGWFWHFMGSATTNTSAQPPVGGVRIDPDSMSTAFVLTKSRNVNTHGLYGLTFSISPATAEFTRKDRVADFVTSGTVTLVFNTICDSLAVSPSVGYEIGRALLKPDTIAGQSVDLSTWNMIGRGVAGGVVELYFFKANATKDDWYYVAFDVSYAARFPVAAEPFVDAGTVNGRRAAVTTVRKNTRQEVEASAHLNLTKYAGVQVQYRYGALPPLFQLVDHQVTIGITLKAARK
jgi:hypothetical protein